MAGAYQVSDDAFIQVHRAFVLTKVSEFMALGQHAPHFRPQAESLWQKLEHDVSMARAITMPAKRREA